MTYLENTEFFKGKGKDDFFRSHVSYHSTDSYVSFFSCFHADLYFTEIAFVEEKKRILLTDGIWIVNYQLEVGYEY